MSQKANLYLTDQGGNNSRVRLDIDCLYNFGSWTAIGSCETVDF